jgi:vitamin B12 transporter
MQFQHALALPLLGGLLIAGQTPGIAQDLDIGEVVVTANRIPTDNSEIGSTVDKITRQQIEDQSQSYVTDYLSLVPGVNVSTPGGAGQEASLSIRGADKKYIKTLFNGIDISDPTSTQVQTPYQNLLAGGIDNIEILKGSQSTLYGSDAIAGVIGISTLGGIPLGVHQRISVEGGSFGTVRGGYSLTGASDTGKAALGIYGVTTKGISAALVNGTAPSDTNPGHLEKDGFRDLNVTFAGQQRINDNVTVFGSALWIDAAGDFDDGGYPPTDNDFNNFTTDQKAGRIGVNVDLLGGRSRNTVSFQANRIDRGLHLVSSFGPYDTQYRGLRTKLDYQGAFDLSRWLTLQYGADYERQRAHSSDSYGADATNRASITGVWSQVDIKPVEGLTLTAGLRHDEHSAFGGHTTYRLTGSYRLLGTATRLHGSFGTGFRSPSLFELYDVYTGNPNLKPEESRSFDAGIEQKFLDGRMIGDLTYFQLNTDDLIDYSFATSHYVQLPGLTRRNGMEASLKWLASPRLQLGAAYTYTHTRQPNGEPRPRIPEHDIALSTRFKPTEKWAIDATAHIVLDTVDAVSPSYGTIAEVPLDDYVLLNARISYKPRKNMEIYLRGENLLNQKYQTIKGYATSGFGVFGGLTIDFGGAT